MKSQLQCYLRMYDFLSDKDVLSLLKKARKLGLCHCTDQASFKESSLCFSCCCPLLQGHPSNIIVHLSLTLTLCSLVELPAPRQDDCFDGVLKFARVGRDPQRPGSKCFSIRKSGFRRSGDMQIRLDSIYAAAQAHRCAPKVFSQRTRKNHKKIFF